MRTADVVALLQDRALWRKQLDRRPSLILRFLLAQKLSLQAPWKT